MTITQHAQNHDDWRDQPSAIRKFTPTDIIIIGVLIAIVGAIGRVGNAGHQRRRVESVI